MQIASRCCVIEIHASESGLNPGQDYALDRTLTVV
ncbi:hypothetical protein CORC01_00433 [Colletotrichum orchidophilum]|uniref:Uncharacterized protein n=1 Tax=Colletotrichum orchidophilum TaxID=1209926 RepID=A0A1G4BRL2_9PEZI|nr:uncharacterized protein CORC01_00433 [Colletotrichum orchidophilum]OHF04094.1 hypothetical protein CORC01_00433 [Colletotrichum orchidophilum]